MMNSCPYHVPLKVTNVTKVNDTTVNVTFAPYHQQHDCPGDIAPVASWYFGISPIPSPVWAEVGRRKLHYHGGQQDLYVYRRIGASGNGFAAATENCYVSHGDDDPMFVTSLVTGEKLVANRPASGFDVFVVSY